MNETLQYNCDIISSILEFMDIEILDTLCTRVSKTFYKISKNTIIKFKMNTPIYNYVLRQDKTRDDMDKMKICFFKMTFFRNHFQDFRKYIFFLFDLIQDNEFILVSRLMKLYYVKKIDYNTIILFFNHDEHNVYFSVIENKIHFRSRFDIPQSGYMIFNGQPQENRDKIMKLIK
jgi:hypothetical protein